MKKSNFINLTLVMSTAVLVTACQRQPKQQLKGYCDPSRPDICYSQPRTGFIPYYYPMFLGSTYYDSYGRVAPAPPANSVAYRQAYSRSLNAGTIKGPSSVTSRSTSTGTASKGGFGSIGGGRAVAG